GPRPRVVDAAERPPRPGEVAVEVDSVRVLSSPGLVAVGVQVLDHPEIQAPRHRKPLERAHNGQAGAFIAVDAADDEQLVVAVRVAELDGLDGTTLDRAADEQASRLDACG